MMVIAVIAIRCSSDYEPKKKVLVIHSWDSGGEDGEPFRQMMKDAFDETGLNVDICHIYLDAAHRRGTLLDKDIETYTDEIAQWKPDVILVNDDPALDMILYYHIADSIFKNTPVVFAGVNTLLRDSLVLYPKMTGFYENIDLIRNMEVATELTRTNSINIELDYTRSDKMLRDYLYKEIAKTDLFINNGDFHIPNTDSAYIDQHHNGKIVINFISFAHPEIGRHSLTLEECKRELGRQVYEARNRWHLQTKFDLFSNVMIDMAKRPQFTAIRENFNNPSRIRFVGGYFTTTRIQISDQVKYATLILNGTKPRQLPVSSHLQEYIIDYAALEKLPNIPAYKDLCDKYTIINTPFKYRNPWLYVFYFIIGFIAICATVALIVFLLFTWRKIGMKRLLESMLYEDKMNRLLFSRRSDTIWYLKGNSMHVTDDFARLFRLPSQELTTWQLREMVDKETLWGLNTLLDYKNQRGRKAIRLHVTPDYGAHWYWVEAIYTVTDENVMNDELYGILINIDDKKAKEDQLLAAHQKNSEVELKQRFLANISHDLRTPLNAVNGFSSLLASEDIELTDEDRTQFCTIIHQNTEMILHMIDSVVQKSQLEAGDIKVYPSETSVNSLVNNCYLTNKVVAPSHLKFRVELQKNDMLINVDVTRTKQVINNLLSNAFKFTPSGSVILGWRYVTNEKQVEIYVRDTGIGVSPEKCSHLFDRYYKADENDAGTGLGLDISKTIMEKQGGQIGVHSELKKGSTFFIRVQRYMTIALLGLIGLFNSSCHNNDEVKHVVVMHNFDYSEATYSTFDNTIKSTLDKNRINAEVINIYLNTDDDYNYKNISGKENIDSIHRNGKCIDAIILEGDRAFLDFRTYYDSIDYLKNIPIVAASLHHPDWDFFRSHKSIVPIQDPIDYCTNINLAVELDGTNMVDIELDHFPMDSIRREELTEAISRPPYVNNCDFHLGDPHPAMPGLQALKDSIIVTAFSAESPERNSKNGTNDIESSIVNIYFHSWCNASVAVKFDLFSSMIADKSNRPQYTAVKSGFADGNARYLAGYFASFETVGHDAATTISRLLKGDDARTLMGLTHKKEYYMDYAAMNTLGYEYDDYDDRFVIVGAPFSLSHKWLYRLIWVGGIFLSLLIIVGASMLAMKWREKGQRKLLEHIMRKADIRKLALLGAESHELKSIEAIEDAIKNIHPSQSDTAVKINQGLLKSGSYTFEVLTQLDSNDGYHWWQLRFVNVTDKNNRSRIDGILINIDEQKKREEELQKASILAQQAQKKENFLKTISHEIRTPLNAVVGFSDVLINAQQNSLTDAEIKYIKKTINDNNEYLKKTLEEVLMFSRVESMAIRYMNEDINVKELMDELYKKWAEKMPPGVSLYTNHHRDNIFIYADRSRIMYILDELMSNAIKFTHDGFIQIGTIYNFITDQVTISISDSGCGLSKEKQGMIFDLFWKDDNFTRGLGLGLNISQKLAQGMNATIKVNSAVEYGSVFYMILPAKLRKQDNND